MKLHNMLPFRRAVCGLVGLATLAKAGGGDGLYQEYCSNENTGSDYSPGECCPDRILEGRVAGLMFSSLQHIPVQWFMQDSMPGQLCLCDSAVPELLVLELYTGKSTKHVGLQPAMPWLPG